jgi:glucokinase
MTDIAAVAHHQFVLTYDVGGSHVSAGLCRLSDLALLRTAEASIAEVSTFEQFADLLHRLGTEAASGETSIAGASLAVPGPFDHEAGVSLMEHKLQYLYGKKLGEALAQRFGWTPDRVSFLNDAASYVLGEVGAGSLKGAKRAAGLTLGTGVGSAFAIGGHCVQHGEGVPPGGEIWDFPYKGGIVEDLISTRALKAAYTQRTGRDLEVAQIAAEAPNDADAREVFAAFGTQFGEVLRDVVSPFRPDMVMIGGGISRSLSLFLPQTEKQIAGLGFAVVASTLLEIAPLTGAGQFFREEKWNRIAAH